MRPNISDYYGSHMTDSSDSKGEFFAIGLGVCHGLIIFTFLCTAWIVGLSLLHTLFGLWNICVIGLLSLVVGALTVIGTRCVLRPIVRTVRRYRHRLSDQQRARLYRRLYRTKKNPTQTNEQA
jgi:hypothetical protein